MIEVPDGLCVTLSVVVERVDFSEGAKVFFEVVDQRARHVCVGSICTDARLAANELFVRMKYQDECAVDGAIAGIEGLNR
jgi:hypothetical protein